MADKYNYTYERTNDYCYPNSDVLINKLNIVVDKDLYVAEQELVGLRVQEILERPLKGNLDFDHLKSIHNFLFQDVYGWAGKPRTCNIAKTNLFCLSPHIDTYAREIFNKLSDIDYFIKLSYDRKLTSLADLFADINALHPFREGNGRTQREFIKYLARINGINFDFTKVESMEMIIASSESTNGDNKKLIAMFKRIATPISKNEQFKYIEELILDKKIKEILKVEIKK